MVSGSVGGGIRAPALVATNTTFSNNNNSTTHFSGGALLAWDFDELAARHGLSPTTFRRRWAEAVAMLCRAVRSIALR